MKHAAIRVVLHWNMAPPPAPPALLNVRAGVRVSQCAVQTCDTFDDCLFRIAAALTGRVGSAMSATCSLYLQQVP